MVLMATEYRVPRVLCVDDNADAADSEAAVLATELRLDRGTRGKG